MAKKKISFESSIERLGEIVKLLENGDLTLDESVKLYKEGIELATLCKERLTSVEREITLLKETADGRLTEENFDIQED